MILATLLVFLMTALAVAGDEKEMQEACDLLGNCNNDMIDQAKAMQVECEKMMERGKEMMEKGKMIRGQAAIWQDKEMEADGNTLYEQGKQMVEEATKMHETCALIIANAEKTKKKYSSKKNKKPEKVLPGDHSPN